MGPQATDLGYRAANWGPQVANSVPQVADSGPQVPNSGPQVADSGPNVANSGPLVANSGPLVANLGPLVANLGPLMANLGPLVANSGPLVALGGRHQASGTNSGPQVANSWPWVADLGPLWLTQPQAAYLAWSLESQLRCPRPQAAHLGPPPAHLRLLYKPKIEYRLAHARDFSFNMFWHVPLRKIPPQVLSENECKFCCIHDWLGRWLKSIKMGSW